MYMCPLFSYADYAGFVTLVSFVTLIILQYIHSVSMLRASITISTSCVSSYHYMSALFHYAGYAATGPLVERKKKQDVSFYNI